jgi:hypothetical protein
VYYYILEEYKVSNELLTEDIYVGGPHQSPQDRRMWSRQTEAREPVMGTACLCRIEISYLFLITNKIFRLSKQLSKDFTHTSQNWRTESSNNRNRPDLLEPKLGSRQKRMTLGDFESGFQRTARVFLESHIHQISRPTSIFERCKTKISYR